MADGLTDSEIYVDSSGGTITFTVVSDPTPPQIAVSEWRSWAYPAISGTFISDTCQIIVEPNEDVRPRDGVIRIDVSTQLNDDEYMGQAYASSAYTIYQQPQIKEPEIQSLTYNIKPFKSGANANTLDVVFANKETEQLIIVDGSEWNITDFPKEQWEPIGIVVIPGNHGVLKDGTGTKNQCGVMSLVGMSCNKPEKGDRDNGISWGGSGIILDISGKTDGIERYDSVTDGLMNYQGIVTTSTSTSNVADGYSKYYAHVPLHTSKWSSTMRFTSPYAPSPYDGDDYRSGGYNESYGLKDGVVVSEENNVLSDFKGIVNTKIITDQVTVSGWKTNKSIEDSSSKGHYPAACCCARYKTVGTKAFVDCSIEELRHGTGFWYLPAMGELAYILPMFEDINNTLSKLKNRYGNAYELQSNVYNYYWSSSEHNSFDAHYIETYWGKVDYTGKDEDLFTFVRAFMRL